ncbi:hypothetical protein Vau01_098850 [Virgisporangium aurantiacum]|uniref:Secreted protein n=1 Tax=Virgisporangium aurantiacum TaxID=175570 RepID=A0A8J3ZE98_9ACTN|nr:hypothetical protein Vau01_098850 [Virgisporangium aurantiacum]
MTFDVTLAAGWLSASSFGVSSTAGACPAAAAPGPLSDTFFTCVLLASGRSPSPETANATPPAEAMTAAAPAVINILVRAFNFRSPHIRSVPGRRDYAEPLSFRCRRDHAAAPDAAAWDGLRHRVLHEFPDVNTGSTSGSVRWRRRCLGGEERRIGQVVGAIQPSLLRPGRSSSLVRRCTAVRRKPPDRFTSENLRIMLGRMAVLKQPSSTWVNL